MMDITAEIVTKFRIVKPVFTSKSEYPDLNVSAALEEADAETGSNRWGVYAATSGNFKLRGMFLFAAHLLMLEKTNPSGPSMAVSQKSVGDESVSFQAVNDLKIGDSWLMTTSYGQQYIRLRKRAGMGAMVV